MDQFFDDAFRPLTTTVSRALGTSPALNVTEYSDRYEISLTIPGINPAEIKVQLDNNVLEIAYNHEEKKQDDQDGQLLRQEYAHFSFSRKVALPKDVDNNSISAKSSKGILLITIKKTPKAQPTKVEVLQED